MARYVYEAYTRVAWVTTISSIAAPTVAELNAGTNITPFITKDGLTTPANQNMVDNASLAETFDAQLVGSWGGAIQLTMFRDNSADTAWNLCVYGTNGYLVVRRGIAIATGWTASQNVEVYPSQMHQPVMAATASNEQQRFTVQLAVTAEPNVNATVAA
jgi:hypothetical protein